MNSKKTISRVGLNYGIFAVSNIVLQLIASLILRQWFPEVLEKYPVELSLGLTVLSVDVIGLLAVVLLNKGVSCARLTKNRFGVGAFIRGIFVCYGCVVAGSMIGSLFQNILTGSTDSAVAELMVNSTMIPRVLVVGILAPIVEELLFRKFLVDRLVKFGPMVAIIASGLMFGLFHGNFSQFFFAAFLGCFFASIYVKTGNILYTIVYHMIINMFSSVLGVYAIGQGLESAIYVGYTLVLFGFGIVGIVIAIVRAKKYFASVKEVKAEGSEDTDSGKISEIFTAPGMWLFYAGVVVLFLINYGVIRL